MTQKHDERLVTELEAAIADVGALLVGAQKYRHGAGVEGAALLREVLELGDAARRQSRHGALDVTTAGGLLDEAHALAARVSALLASVHTSPAYRNAVTAHAAGDQRALVRLLPEVFAGLEHVGAAPDVFHPIASHRRNRLRPVAEVVAEVVNMRDHGLEADGDDLSPGADPALPAVVLLGEPPIDDAIVLRMAAGSIPVPVYRLVDSGEYLAYAARVRVPFTVLLARAPDAGAEGTLDAPHRDALAAALVDAGVPVADAS